MNILSLILGETGTGKSRAIKNLDPEKTIIANSEVKALPFRTKFKGNIPCSNPMDVFTLLDALMHTEESKNSFLKKVGTDEKYASFVRVLKFLESKDFFKNRPNVFVLDSFSSWQNDMLRMVRSQISGYDVWSKYAEYIDSLFKKLKMFDGYVFLNGHTEFVTNADGESIRSTKVKGNEWKGVVEREFTCVFFAEVSNEDDVINRRFLTNRIGDSRPAKTPEEMFPTWIDNDLDYICKTFDEYYGITR